MEKKSLLGRRPELAHQRGASTFLKGLFNVPDLTELNLQILLVPHTEIFKNQISLLAGGGEIRLYLSKASIVAWTEILASTLRQKIGKSGC